jgi:hypothetical protein
VEYAPGDHVTLAFPGGRVSRFKAADLTSVQVGAQQAPTQVERAVEDAKEVPVPQRQEATPRISDASQAAVVQALMTERADWQNRDTGMLVPIAFTATGILATALGAMMIPGNDGPFEDNSVTDAGYVVLAGGLVALGGGIGFWINRTSDTRKEQELRRINNQLMLYGVQAQLSPWFVPRTSQRAGASAGLTLTLKL